MLRIHFQPDDILKLRVATEPDALWETVLSLFRIRRLLNLLCATRAALNGAETADLAIILAEPEIAPLASAARRMSEADAAIVRAFLPTISGPSIRDMVESLEAEGLIEPDAA